MAPKKKPLVADIFCGLGGWTEGFLAEDYDAVGFDIERHHYGDQKYPGDLVLQDARTIHGKQLKDAAVIVASSPCQAYSYMAMPWKRAKQIARALRGEDVFPEGYTGYRTIAELNELFEQPKRIQREACEAAGRYIPMIQENVRGAIPWVGRSQWNFGSYHLWGDMPALMPFTHKGTKPGGGASWYPPDDPRHQPGLDFTRLAGLAAEGQKTSGHVNARDGHSHTRHLTNQAESRRALSAAAASEGKKGVGIGSASWQDKEHRHPNDPRNTWSGSIGRKAASAAIAKIPFSLSQHIARVYKREVPHAR